MINFVEYVISELKNKRLSKENAFTLIKQFSRPSSSVVPTSIIHPLLHTNTSNFSHQCYSSTFSGNEFFLNDHQVNGQKVLPGAAYLEMIRAAFENAIPFRPDSTITELQNIIWMQPLVVTETMQIIIDLFIQDDDSDSEEIDFEVYSIETDTEDNQQKKVYCQGQAKFVSSQKEVNLDIEYLKTQMLSGRLVSPAIYSLYARLGMNFGSAHQALVAIDKGEQQVIAELSLPASVNINYNAYTLHPSLLDGALQAVIGLILKDFNNLPTKSTQSLPFALKSLRVFSACTKKMFAWIRYSQDCRQEDGVAKMDIDLCDQDGNICVQIRELSSKVLDVDNRSFEEQNKNMGTLLAVPMWESTITDASPKKNQVEYKQHHVVMIGFDKLDEKKVEGLLPQCRFHKLPSVPQKNISDRYSEIALTIFELIRKILEDKLQGDVLVQIVINNLESDYEEIFTGLSGLLKTATLENFQLASQIIFIKQQIAEDEFVRRIQESKTGSQNTIIKFEREQYALKLKEIQIDHQDVPPIVFKDKGVYLITGGLGGLGIIFAKEILKQTQHAKIILTGRSELTVKKQAVLDKLSTRKNRVFYEKLDLTDIDQIRRLISGIIKEHKQLNGVIHSAGMHLDNFIIKKTSAEFNQVLIPKVTGTYNLDQATQDVDMDFMVLFSSGASITGNVGQADYAAANGFMDQFSSYRNRLVALNKRHGKTLSINWPLWEEGGMDMEEKSQEFMKQKGMHSMKTITGINAFYQSLTSQYDQLLVAEGNTIQLRHTLINGQSVQHSSSPVYNNAGQPIIAGIDVTSLGDKTRDYLRKEFSALLKLPAQKIDPNAPLEKYGIDSILAMELTSQLEKTFGFLSKTLLFEYQTIDELTKYFVKSHSDKLLTIFNISDSNQEKTATITPEAKIETKIDVTSLEDKTRDYLRKEFSTLLKLPAQKINPTVPLEKYGIDSILAMELTSQLEKTFGFLSKTLFFEYQTIDELTKYFIKSHSDKLLTIFDISNSNQEKTANTTSEAKIEAISQIPTKINQQHRFFRQRQVNIRQNVDTTQKNEPIAIIGLSGRYPEAYNIEEYWKNLYDGKDCITEIPKERWDWRKYYSEDRTKTGYHSSKWGGFIAGVDEFDPRFFNISPREAILLDPQERLFLQHAWMAIEDAGYTRAGLQMLGQQDLVGQIGVYAGVMYGEYNLSGSLASIANRVSYVLNLHGPSMVVDTMCSSSLTAIHLACQDLQHGRTCLSIAGGVNVSVHPNKYMMLSSGQFISNSGHCQSFGEGGDGYIPGEGVGVVILKRLSDAQKDGDHIYGIIKGSVLNHGGKTNGYTVPNPHAQSDVISRALKESNTDPCHISYIEAHGTGTKLGDPIEITALTQAFQKHTQDTGFCMIGSAKSNIGHCESAAGIAGLTKVLLQFKHKQIVPSLHSKRLNPNIDFDKTPFVVNQTLRHWEQPVIDGQQIPRIAGISSFGAGGANAHVILQEYTAPVEITKTGIQQPYIKALIPLSARTDQQLKQKARDLLNFIRSEQETPIDLLSMAYTLQTGRESMEERLGFIVNSVKHLAEKLQAYIDGEQNIEGVYQEHSKHNKDTLSVFNTDTDLQEAIDKWIVHGKFSKLLDLWVKGLDLDWNRMYGESKPSRISLPVYPFAKERYWKEEEVSVHTISKSDTAASLHPLVHVNTSDLTQVSYSSTFSENEFFLTDYHMNDKGIDKKIIPSMIYLEMVCAAVQQALITQKRPNTLELFNIVWGQLAVVNENKKLTITLQTESFDQVDYEIYSTDNGVEVIHCQGWATFISKPDTIKIDIGKLQKQMIYKKHEQEELYRLFSAMGFHYNIAYRSLSVVNLGDKQLLAQLRLPVSLENDKGNFVLHPCLLDGVLQAAICLVTNVDQPSLHPFLPFSLGSLRIIRPCTSEMYAWVRYSQEVQSDDPFIKLDIDLCDNQGNVCVQIREFSLRQIGNNTVPTPLVSKPQDIWLNDFQEITSIENRITTKLQTISLNDLQSETIIINDISDDHSVLVPGLLSLEELTPSEERIKDYSTDQLQQILKTTLAEVLYLNSSEIDIDKSFIDLGLDSIVGVEWIKIINKKFDLDISSTKIYDYPTIKQLAAFLEKELEKEVTKEIIS